MEQHEMPNRARFAEVIPHRRVPKQFASFTYEIPVGMKIQKGSIVTVPFKSQEIFGIVDDIHENKPHYKTRTIASVSSIALPEPQLRLAHFLSTRWESSLANAFDLFIPEKVWALQSAEDTSTRKKILYKYKERILIKKCIQQLAERRGGTFFFEKSPLPRKDFYTHLQKMLKPGEQALFLIPESSFAENILSRLSVYHGGLNEKEKARLWQSVYSDSMQALFGTRAALFLPFKNLKYIVIDFEHNQNYQEKRQPQYHAVEVAQHLASLLAIPLIMISATPRVETYNQIILGGGIFNWEEKNKNAQMKIISLADERKKGMTGLFAPYTVSSMARAFSKGQQVLLFVHRTGESTALLCRDCSEVVRCGICSTVLSLHAGQKLQCHRCRRSSEMPDACAHCGGMELKKLGAGTEKLEIEIKKIFSRASIFRLDREAIKKQALPTSAQLNTFDVLVTSPLIEKPFNLPRLRLSIAVLPDPMLHFPHFRAAERVIQLLVHIRNLTHPRGEMLIQTYMPDSPVYRALCENNLERYYTQELNARKSLGLPPFNNIWEDHAIVSGS